MTERKRKKEKIVAMLPSQLNAQQKNEPYLPKKITGSLINEMLFKI